MITDIFGIFGYPVYHSLSPVMHNAAFDVMGLHCRYLPFEVRSENLKKAVEAIYPLGMKGINITIPHKEAVVPLLDEVDEEAQCIGAVNTIEVREEKLVGHNTDGRGFLTSLLERGVDPSAMRVILIGVGGGAKGVAFTLAKYGVSEIILVARKLARGEGLAKRLTLSSAHLKISVIGMDDIPSLGRQTAPTLLINATPLGMKEDDPLPFPSDLLDPSWVVADLLYRPRETPLLSAAKKRGATIIPGIGMLLHQGALSFEIWTHQKAPIQVMRDALERALHSHP